MKQKLIKRYSNRKLYDTDTSRYITIREIVKLPLGSFKIVFQGHTGHATGDVTTETLLSALTDGAIAADTKVEVMKYCINELTPPV